MWHKQGMLLYFFYIILILIYIYIYKKKKTFIKGKRHSEDIESGNLVGGMSTVALSFLFSNDIISCSTIGLPMVVCLVGCRHSQKKFT